MERESKERRVQQSAATLQKSSHRDSPNDAPGENFAVKFSPSYGMSTHEDVLSRLSVDTK